MRVIEVNVLPAVGKRVRGLATVLLSNGCVLKDVKVVKFKNQYFVVIPSRDEGECAKGLDRPIRQAMRDHVLNEYIFVATTEGRL